MIKNLGIGTGRRKTSVARVYVRDGNGKITINERICPLILPWKNTRIWFVSR